MAACKTGRWTSWIYRVHLESVIPLFIIYITQLRTAITVFLILRPPLRRISLISSLRASVHLSLSLSLQKWKLQIARFGSVTTVNNWLMILWQIKVLKIAKYAFLGKISSKNDKSVRKFQIRGLLCRMVLKRRISDVELVSNYQEWLASDRPAVYTVSLTECSVTQTDSLGTLRNVWTP